MKVRIIHAGYYRTVPACRVIPRNPDIEIVEEVPNSSQGTEEERLGSRPKVSQRMEDQEQLEETDTEVHQPNKEMRPKRNQTVEFILNGISKFGKVTHVGKAVGKDKNRCWIKLRNSENKEESYDFVEDIQSWKVFEKVTFSNQTVDNKTSSQGMDVENESHGVWLMAHRICCVEEFESPDDVNEVVATNIPSKEHHHPEVIEAKKKELVEWKEFNAAEEVEYTGKEHVLSSH